MKNVMIIILIIVATAAWSDVLLQDPEMRIFSGIKSANSWLGIGLCLEGVGFIGVAASMPLLMESEDLTLLYISTGVFGIGMIIQMITTTVIGASSVRLSNSIIQSGSDAPKPTGVAGWSLLSTVSMGGALSLSIVASLSSTYETYNTLSTIGGVLALTSIVSAGVTYFNVNGYGEEIGWEEYKKANQLALMEQRNALSDPAFPDTGRRPEIKVRIPLLSIRY